MKTPFDQAHKSCSTFAWNLITSVRVLQASEELNMENEEHKSMYDALIENHCRCLSDGVSN